jgi:MFS family permease
LRIAGGIPPYIYSEIGGVDRWIWFVLAYLIALAGVCPFVGSLSDLIGRRYVALIGSMLIIVGIIVSSTAHHMNTFIGGLEIFFSRIKSPSAVTSVTVFVLFECALFRICSLNHHTDSRLTWILQLAWL